MELLTPLSLCRPRALVLHSHIFGLGRFRVVPRLSTSKEVLDELEASAEMVAQIIAEAASVGNQSMYGTTTGFGGSGRLRTIVALVSRADLFVPHRMLLNLSVSLTRDSHSRDDSLTFRRSTRVTTAIPKLQRVLIKGLQAGITLPAPTDPGAATGAVANVGIRSVGYTQDLHTLNASSLIMPEEWVKGTYPHDIVFKVLAAC